MLREPSLLHLCWNPITAHYFTSLWISVFDSNITFTFSLQKEKIPRKLDIKS